MSRNTKGIIGWSLLALLFGIIVAIPMYLREKYQYEKYLKPCKLDFEWDDIIRYGSVIAVFSIFHWAWVNILDLPLILAL